VSRLISVALKSGSLYRDYWDGPSPSIVDPADLFNMQGDLDLGRDLVREVCHRVQERVLADPRVLGTLEPRAFEYLIAELLRNSALT